MQAAGLTFRGDMLDLCLADGRRVLVPLDFYPTLKAATPSQRRAWEFIGPGEGFHWERFDLQLAAEDIAAGRREHIPPPGWRERMDADLNRLGLTNKAPTRKLRRSA